MSVTNWTLPAIVIFSQVPPLESLFRFARMNQTMNTKFGTNINITIQNPHQVSPLSICSFPTMMSPLNNKKEEYLDDWGCSFFDTVWGNFHLTYSTFIYSKFVYRFGTYPCNPSMKRLTEFYKLYRDLPIFEALLSSLEELGEKNILSMELIPSVVHQYDQVVFNLIQLCEKEITFTATLLNFR